MSVLSNENSTTEKNSGILRVRTFLITCAAIVLVFLAIGPMAFSSDWVSSSDFHACIEISSSFIAIIAAIACLIYYFGLGSRYFLIIGLGFFICGSESMIHGILSFERLFAGSGADFSRSLPVTYIAGRLMLAVMIIAAALLETKLKRTKNLRRQAVIFSSIALILGGGATALAFALPLPKCIYPELTIPRPFDFASALLFVVAFAMTLKRFRGRQDIFTGSLLVCILLNIGGQVYMSFSKQLFNSCFDIAHFANILSYCVPVTGIVIQGLQEMKTSQHAENKLAKHRDLLEVTVEKRTADLTKSNENLKNEIDERKRMEKELRQSNRQLEASIERSNMLAQEVTISNSTLNERVKELNCLYSISNITENSENSLEEILQGIVDLIPTGLQYPQITGARINFEGCEYKTKSYRDTLWKMSSDITFQGKKIGVVEVVYLEERPPIDEGPFPKEEKRLLNEIADRLSLIITRRQTDKMVQATNDFLESIMESITNAIFVIDMEGISTLVSQAGSKITGYEINEMIDKPFSMLFDPVINEELNKEFVKVKVVGDQISQYEAEMIRKDGKKIFVMLNFAPLYEKDKIVSIVGTVEDITNRKELEQQLLQSQKLESIGQLASGIAHEINTPAQYVCDNTRFLQESFNDITSLMKKHNGLLEAAKSGNIPRKMLEDMEKASKELDIEYLLDEIPQAFKQTIEGIERVSELVRAMKEFSRPCVEGKIAIDINKAIQNTITVARNEWKYVAEIKTEFDPELPMVLCLPREFNQVILNIIVNAAQAIAVDGKENAGTITVKTLVDDKWAQIRVSDTGTGIPENIQDKIYDPFFTTKGVGNGTGQGLAIARSIIVDKHDGTITFETEKGKGTTFIIRLPIDSVSN